MDIKTWDKGHKVLGGLLGVAIIIAVLLGTCKRPSGEVCLEIKDTTITTTVNDTNWHDTTIVHWDSKPVPVPYFDTMYPPEILELIERGRNAFVRGEDFDESFILKYPAIYIDTIYFDTVAVYYRAKVRGYLDAIKVGYRLRKPFSITQTDIYRIEVSEPAKKRYTVLYLGLDVGGNKDSFGYFKPELSLMMKNTSYSVGYNIPDKSITAGAKIKLLPLKR
ncbi:hypothetical protein LCGC14_0770870 [marine sediment metagenome]|uniref:Uncharacterized protein n=1 Tax=marine sediment metagenome TaxID=412755 RepID=A0A0F9Q2H8_9ZZZZ